MTSLVFRPARALLRRLAAEIGQIAAAVRAPLWWGALGIALALWSLAYQVAPIVRLDIGGDRTSRQRGFDTPFLDNFNASEPADQPNRPWYTADAPPYRWTRDTSTVTLSGIGGDLWLLRVTAASGRPDGSPVTGVWRSTDDLPVALQIDAQPRTYMLLLRTDPAGNLRLTFETPRMNIAADPRILGMPVFRIVASPIGTAPYRPSWMVLAWLVGALTGIVAVLHRARAPTMINALLVPATVLLFAWMIATRRTDLTIVAPTAAALIWIARALIPVIDAVLNAMQPADDAAPAAGVTAGAWFVRMAGMLHPYALTSDLGLHVNNLADVARGILLFTEGLPCRAGAGPQPYPPGGYLILLPFVLLTGADRAALTLLVQSGTAVLESLTTAAVWLLLRRAGAGKDAALYGALLYAVAPPILRAYSVGEMANLLAHAFVAPLMLWLTQTRDTVSRRAALVGTILVLGILLSHGGVALSTGAMLAVWFLLRAVWRRASVQTPDGIPWRTAFPWRQAGMFTAAGVAALALFYSAFGHVVEERQIAQAALAAQGIVCPPGDPLLDKLNRWILGLIFTPGAPVAPLAVAIGVTGAALINRSQHGASGETLAACWLGTLVSMSTLLIGDQPVRWTLFTYPALCAGAGVALAKLQRRGRTGAILTLTTLCFLIWYGIADWVRQVSEYLR
ncbi:MAG: hypothetical protein ACUVSY_06725 [Roseiflexus sp.]